MSKPSFWWEPAAHAEKRRFLTARAALAKAARGFFDVCGFIEADTAILQISPGNETHISAFATEMIAPGGEKSRLYLHSSPEFALKKLLAAGEDKIFSLGHVFRNRERGPLHHPEFTMLEWYRTNAPYTALFADCGELLAAAANAAQTDTFRFRDATADAFAEPEILTVAEAFQRYARDSISSRPTIRAAVTARRSRKRLPRSACASPTTTHGPISSAKFFRRRLNQISGMGARHCSSIIPRRRPRWRG